MGEPDALSRRTDHGSHNADNQRVVLLSPSAFQIHTMRATLIRGPEKTILQDIREGLATHKATEEPRSRPRLTSFVGTRHMDSCGHPNGERRTASSPSMAASMYQTRVT